MSRTWAARRTWRSSPRGWSITASLLAKRRVRASRSCPGRRRWWAILFTGPLAKTPRNFRTSFSGSKPLAGLGLPAPVNVNLAVGKPVPDCVRFLDAGRDKDSAVLSEKLGDLYATLGKPSSAVHAYKQALNYRPFPSNNGGGLLTLAEDSPRSNVRRKLTAITCKCCGNVRITHKLGLYRKLLPLAQKLKKTDDAQQYEAEINRLNPPPSCDGLLLTPGDR